MIDNTTPPTVPGKTPQEAGGPQAGVTRKPGSRWALPVAALVAGLVLGGALGAAVVLSSSDPTQTEEYRALEEELADAEGLVEKARDDVRLAATTAAQTIKDAEETLLAKATELDQREGDLVAREQAVTAITQRIAATSIGEGSWTVGRDIEPGTYRTATAVTGSCYWGIYRSGTNGSDIIDNDNVQGGFPTVTLSAGQDFANNRCGVFVKE